MDVITSLMPLIETNTLAQFGQGQTIQAASGFQLFMTYRIQSAGRSSFLVRCHHCLGKAARSDFYFFSG